MHTCRQHVQESQKELPQQGISIASSNRREQSGHASSAGAFTPVIFFTTSLSKSALFGCGSESLSKEARYLHVCKTSTWHEQGCPRLASFDALKEALRDTSGLLDLQVFNTHQMHGYDLMKVVVWVTIGWAVVNKMARLVATVTNIRRGRTFLKAWVVIVTLSNSEANIHTPFPVALVLLLRLSHRFLPRGPLCKKLI